MRNQISFKVRCWRTLPGRKRNVDYRSIFKTWSVGVELVFHDPINTTTEALMLDAKLAHTGKPKQNGISSQKIKSRAEINNEISGIYS